MTTNIALVLLFNIIQAQDLTPIADVKTLSELSINKLLNVKNSLFEDDVNVTEKRSDTFSNDTNNPTAMALKKTNDIKRGDYEDSKDKGSIQHIFQTSVTALAFLAFGGYLVCLITQAINGNVNGNQVVVMSSLKKPIRYRKPNRYKLPTIKRPGSQRHKRNASPGINSEELYDALISLSEGYTQLHTADSNLFSVTTKEKTRRT